MSAHCLVLFVYLVVKTLKHLSFMLPSLSGYLSTHATPFISLFQRQDALWTNHLGFIISTQTNFLNFSVEQQNLCLGQFSSLQISISVH